MSRDYLMLAVAATVISALLVFLVRRYALRAMLLLAPTARDSHSVPTPRGGGIAVVLPLLVLLLYLGVVNSEPVLLLAAGGMALVAAIGWIDDHGSVGAARRLMVHIVAAGLVLPLARTLPPNQWLAHPAALLWWAVWSVSAINVINFLDGIDGLIGTQMALFGVHLSLLSSSADGMAFGAVLTGGSIGFLLWNWAPARIFLGDVGSGALGLAAVIGGLLTMRDGSSGLVATFLPLYPLFLDAAATLVRRARRGEVLHQAHRSHLYQRLANEHAWGHARVTLLFAAAAVAGVVVPHLPAAIFPGAVAAYFVIVAAAGVLLEWIMDRSRPECPDASRTTSSR